MLSLYCWSAERKNGQLCKPETLRSLADRIRGTNDVVWIDLDRPTEDEEFQALEQFLPIHPLTFLDITQRHHEPEDRGHLPKVEAFPDYLFVVVNPLRDEFAKRATVEYLVSDDPKVQPFTQLSAVLTRNVLVTHHREPLEAIRGLHSHLFKHQEQAGRGPDYLFHLILDALIDRLNPVLDHVQDGLEEMEDDVFVNPSRKMLERLLALKRKVSLLRKTLAYEREVLARLARGDFELIDAREMVYYRNVYDHIVRSNELIETSREMVSDLMQTYMSAASNKLNEIMKVLTLISTIVLPMTLVAGVYGMNFHHMPELDWTYGYPFALGLMLLVGLGGVGLFKWKRWL